MPDKDTHKPSVENEANGNRDTNDVQVDSCDAHQDSPESETKNKELERRQKNPETTAGEEIRTENEEPAGKKTGTENQGSVSALQESGVSNEGSRISDQETGVTHTGSKLEDEEIRTSNKETGITHQGLRLIDGGQSGSSNQELGRENRQLPSNAEQELEKEGASQTSTDRVPQKESEIVEENERSQIRVVRNVGQAQSDQKGKECGTEGRKVVQTINLVSETEFEKRSSDSSSEESKSDPKFENYDGGSDLTDHGPRPIFPVTMAVFEKNSSSPIDDYMSRTSHISSEDEDMVKIFIDDTSSCKKVVESEEMEEELEEPSLMEQFGDCSSEDPDERVLKWQKEMQDSSSSSPSPPLQEKPNLFIRCDSSSPTETKEESSACSSRKKSIDEESPAMADGPDTDEEWKTSELDTDPETDKLATKDFILLSKAGTDGTLEQRIAGLSDNQVRGQKRKRFTKRRPRKRFRTKYLSPASGSKKVQSIADHSDKNEGSMQILNVSGELAGLEIGAEVSISGFSVDNSVKSRKRKLKPRQSVCSTVGTKDRDLSLNLSPKRSSKRQTSELSNRGYSRKVVGEAIKGSHSNLRQGRKRVASGESETPKKLRMDNLKRNVLPTEEPKQGDINEFAVSKMSGREGCCSENSDHMEIDVFNKKLEIRDQEVPVDKTEQISEEIVVTECSSDGWINGVQEVVIVDKAEQISEAVGVTESFGDRWIDCEQEVVVVNKKEFISEEIVTTESFGSERTCCEQTVGDTPHATEKDSPIEDREGDQSTRKSVKVLEFPGTAGDNMKLKNSQVEVKIEIDGIHHRNLAAAAICENFESMDVTQNAMMSENEQMNKTAIFRRIKEHDVLGENLPSGKYFDCKHIDTTESTHNESVISCVENIPSTTESIGSQAETEMVTIEVIVETERVVKESEDDNEAPMSVDVDELKDLVSREEPSAVSVRSAQLDNSPEKSGDTKPEQSS